MKLTQKMVEELEAKLSELKEVKKSKKIKEE